MTIERVAVWLGSAAMAAMAATSAAHAGAFAIHEQSACGQGVSFAGVATGCNISSSFWNVAALAKVEGIEVEAVGSGIFPKVEIDPVAPTPTIGLGGSGDIGQDAFVPATYAAARVSERVVLGVSVSSPFGLVTNPNDVWAGQTYSLSSRVFSVNVNPMATFEVNDWLALGAGAQIQYFETRLRQAIGVAPGAPTAQLDGDDVGYGFNLGALVTPMPGTEVGLGFRSSITHELEGELATPFGTGDIEAEIDLPEIVSLGIRQRVTDRMRLMGTVEWSNWSRLGEIPVFSATGVQIDLNPGQPGIQGLPFDYDDGWFFALGGEYDVTQELTVRAGVAWELSPISDEVRATRLPDDDRLWLSTGLTYAHSERISMDLGYSFVKTFGTEIEIAPGNPNFNGLPFFADVESSTHIISAAVKVRFGGAPAPVQ